MALPASGVISLNAVNVELGLSGTTTISMNQASLRTLFGVGSGGVSMSNGYGKANEFTLTISANQTNANLATLATNAGWDGSTKLNAIINSGIYISSNSTGVPALTINGSFPGGVELINNGYIVGRGGNGGAGTGSTSTGSPSGGSAGSSGGLALSVSSAISINNASGTIGGGGGGGGGGGHGYWFFYTPYVGGGGGGGGGRSSTTNSSGGSGGVKGGGYPGSNGGAGGAGTTSAAGGGGGRGGSSPYFGGNGGGGGAWGSSGSSGAGGQNGGGGGNGSSSGGKGAGGGGAATSGQANVTWVATGTRLGTLG